jgi:hypothetical protein
MAIRVFSGELDIRNHEGNSGEATILFHNHEVFGDVDEDHHSAKQRIGGRGNFPRNDRPCSIISMRRIKIHETESRPSEPKHEIDKLKLLDHIYYDRLEITWAGTGGSKIEGIAYMVIGETGE